MLKSKYQKFHHWKLCHWTGIIDIKSFLWTRGDYTRLAEPTCCCHWQNA